jgi:sulfur-oxidizing protein SoxX
MTENLLVIMVLLSLRWKRDFLIEKYYFNKSGTTKSDPNSFMPPFGKHGALTKTEINKIMDYLYTL